MNIFFTSDTHFFHSNILKYSDRPYNSIGQMNEALIKNWNSVVNPRDTVYHLGDVAFASKEKTKEVVSRLNGKIILIFGNHDKTLKKDIKLQHTLFSQCYNYYTLNYNRDTFIMFHFPILNWDRRQYGSIHLHGHDHLTDYKTENMYNVGVDLNNYTPISLEEIVKR